VDPTSPPGASPAPHDSYAARSVTARLVRGLFAVTIVVTVTEFLIMAAIERFFTEPWNLWEPSVDSVTLLCVLVLFFVRPMVRSFRELAAPQDEVRRARDELELRVQVRTEKARGHDGNGRNLSNPAALPAALSLRCHIRETDVAF